MVEQVFARDEMLIHTNTNYRTKDKLRKMEGLIYLKDVCHILSIDSVTIKKHHRRHEEEGAGTAYSIMGVRKVWSHWVIRLKVFMPYYEKYLVSTVREVDRNWDGNTLLAQDGIFILADVCQKIPFSTHQLRYRAKLSENPRAECGIWKDEERKLFLVEMQTFSPWVKTLWQGW